jgi:sulfur-carrier protein
LDTPGHEILGKPFSFVTLRVRRFYFLSKSKKEYNTRMAVIRIPTPLRPYVNGQSEVTVQGGTVADAMESLLAQYPAMRPHLTNPDGQLRPFVNLFLGESNVRDMHGLQTPLQDGDKLLLIPSIAGGSER